MKIIALLTAGVVAASFLFPSSNVRPVAGSFNMVSGGVGFPTTVLQPLTWGGSLWAWTRGYRTVEATGSVGSGKEREIAQAAWWAAWELTNGGVPPVNALRVVDPPENSVLEGNEVIYTENVSPTKNTVVAPKGSRVVNPDGTVFDLSEKTFFTAQQAQLWRGPPSETWDGLVLGEGTSYGLALGIYYVAYLTNTELPDKPKVGFTGGLDAVGNVLPVDFLAEKVATVRAASVSWLVAPQEFGGETRVVAVKTLNETVVWLCENVSEMCPKKSSNQEASS